MRFIVVFPNVSLIFILGYGLYSVPCELINVVKSHNLQFIAFILLEFFSLNVAVTLEIYFKIYKVLGYFSCLQIRPINHEYIPGPRIL